MSEGNTFTITMPPDKFETAKNALYAKAQGVFPYSEESDGTATSGSVTDEGVTANFSYSTATQVLTVTIIKKPFLVSEGFIEGKVREWFAA